MEDQVIQAVKDISEGLRRITADIMLKKGQGMPIAYFAHSLRTYETLMEQWCHDYIFDQGYACICPNYHQELIHGNDSVDSLTGAQIMHNCIAYIQNHAQALFVMTDNEGFVPKGCHDEVVAALQKGIPIRVIGNNAESEFVSIIVNDPNDWKFKYAKINMKCHRNQDS